MTNRQIHDNWIYEYLRYTAGQESPEPFHIWTALTVLSTVLDRHVWIKRGYYTLYPNLYVILVAGSALCRKSTAVKIGRKILDAMNTPPPVFSDKLTPEALIRALANEVCLEEGFLQVNSSSLVFAPELSVFFTSGARDNGLLTLLTDFYDSPDDWAYVTKGQGKDTLKNVCINILGASTPKWLRSSIPDDAIGGGFISRTVLVYQERPKLLEPFPDEQLEREGFSAEASRKKLIADLNQISTLAGEIEIPKPSRDWYKDWYPKDMQMIVEHPNSDYLVRRPDTIFKVAMILSAAENDDLVILPEHLEKARMLLDDILAQMNPAVEQLSTASSSDGLSKVITLFKKTPKMSHADLQRKCWYYAKSFDLEEIIQTLIDASMIEMEIRGTRGKRIYTATSKLYEEVDHYDIETIYGTDNKT